MPNRYDIRFYQENDTQLRVWINDKLCEYETLKGIITCPISAERANSFKNDLTDAVRRYAIPYEEIPGLIENWLHFLSENKEKEFTDDQN